MPSCGFCQIHFWTFSLCFKLWCAYELSVRTLVSKKTRIASFNEHSLLLIYIVCTYLPPHKVWNIQSNSNVLKIRIRHYINLTVNYLTKKMLLFRLTKGLSICFLSVRKWVYNFQLDFWLKLGMVYYFILLCYDYILIMKKWVKTKICTLFKALFNFQICYIVDFKTNCYCTYWY